MRMSLSLGREEDGYYIFTKEVDIYHIHICIVILGVSLKDFN